MILVAVTAALALAGCGDDGGDDTASELRLPPAGRWFGISSNTFQHTGRNELDQGVTPARAVADAVAAGANSVRVQVAWWDLERTRGRVDRGYARLIRRFVARLERAGGRALLVLGVPPPWASAKPGDPRAAPLARSVRDYAAYAARVARLFPTALAIETWNEPNADFFWVPRRPDARLYARMHRAAAAAIRRANPDVKVLLGGLIAVPDDNDQIVAPATYLQGMYAAGLRERDYDGVAVHVYPGEEAGRTLALDRVLEPSLDNTRSGLRGKPELWVTETGVSTSGPDGVPPAEQARGLVATVARLFDSDDVKGVWVHTQYDVPTYPRADRERGFGLLRARGARPGRPKPAFCALARRSAKADSRCR